MRFENLDEKKKGVTIRLEGKDFEITRLTLCGRDLCNKFLLTAYEVQELQTDFIDTLNKIDTSDLDSAKKKIKQLSESNTLKAQELEKRFEIVQEEAVKKILVDNGYEYEKKFWDGIDGVMFGEFITLVMQKDNSPEKKKEIVV